MVRMRMTATVRVRVTLSCSLPVIPTFTLTRTLKLLRQKAQQAQHRRQLVVEKQATLLLMEGAGALSRAAAALER